MFTPGSETTCVYILNRKSLIRNTFLDNVLNLSCSDDISQFNI